MTGTIYFSHAEAAINNFHITFIDQVRKRQWENESDSPIKYFKICEVSRHPDGIKAEEDYRLLVNPCEDFPYKHLEYGEEGTFRAKKMKKESRVQK